MKRRARVYFDESGTHADSRVIGMAGYWFEAEQAERFSRDWAKQLLRFGLSAAHQTDCASGFGEYRGMSKSDRVEVQKALIENIRRRSKFSVAVCFSRATYEEIFADVIGAPSAYTFMLLLCVNKIAEEIEARKFDGKVEYIFEAGHADQSEANKFMNFLAQQTHAGVTEFRYAGHRFDEKMKALPLQAADMLAWQTRHYFERILDGHSEPRKDFVALTRPQDLHTIVRPDHMLALRQFYANAGEIFGDRLTDPNASIPGMDLAEGIARALGLSLDNAREVREWLSQDQLRGRRRGS